MRSDAIRRAYELRKTGFGYREIAKRICAEMGECVSKDTVARFLKNKELREESSEKEDSESYGELIAEILVVGALGALLIGLLVKDFSEIYNYYKQRA